ncbi:MAG: tRNA (adenosine(37)-N6)-threonylcarbamoyltransferase complex ATPase subunit type 1 TsaE [Cyclobacteriaceae bacterium]|nr:tRNA (adenosine(37)-N6)-threonylcarbamoyltransferase complex ATPase subunit type 1 TsaE [Cyclobacteriaceae bacterium]MDX5468077.1 tRNA (adenosine(37)-N6)-threonylcarbamoyltransferase complex ATPase subunit type 1 TsaE [Cyclobacteriaceae bacterium]
MKYNYELGEIRTAAQWLIRKAKGDKIWVFQGQMGAGKTTLIKALAEEFGVKDEVSSPTFGIVNEYQAADSQKIFHFDFYRIDDPEEVLEIGIEEYFYGGSLCWIEWAEKIAQFIPDDFLLIKLEILSDTERLIQIQHS